MAKDKMSADPKVVIGRFIEDVIRAIRIGTVIVVKHGSSWYAFSYHGHKVSVHHGGNPSVSIDDKHVGFEVLLSSDAERLFDLCCSHYDRTPEIEDEQKRKRAIEREALRIRREKYGQLAESLKS